MRETILQTPEGVRDIYNSECDRKLTVLDSIQRVLHLYGNHDIETPHFEFFNIFNLDKGSAASSEMYKFFDRNNNTLVLRPDITPSVARCVAKYYPEENLPIRLCYKGHTFINAPQHQGKLNEITQIGCELFNDDSSAADAEMLACIIDCLKSTGLEEFQVALGEVDYFKGLVEEAGITPDVEKQIRSYIAIKNFFGLDEYISTLNLDERYVKAFSELDTLFGGLETLDRAYELVENEKSRTAIDRMRKVYTAISYYGYESYISFDLSMINGYNYYTGIVFRGFTYGVGNPIVKGGRYNNLLSQFGKDAPSIGFAIYIDELMNALSRQNLKFKKEYIQGAVIYDIENQQAAVKLAKKLREEGIRTELIRQSKRHSRDEYLEHAKKNHIDRLYFIDADNEASLIETESEDKTAIKLEV